LIGVGDAELVGVVGDHKVHLDQRSSLDGGYVLQGHRDEALDDGRLSALLDAVVTAGVGRVIVDDEVTPLPLEPRHAHLRVKAGLFKEHSLQRQ